MVAFIEKPSLIADRHDVPDEDPTTQQVADLPPSPEPKKGKGIKSKTLKEAEIKRGLDQGKTLYDLGNM